MPKSTPKEFSVLQKNLLFLARATDSLMPSLATQMSPEVDQALQTNLLGTIENYAIWMPGGQNKEREAFLFYGGASGKVSAYKFTPPDGENFFYPFALKSPQAPFPAAGMLTTRWKKEKFGWT